MGFLGIISPPIREIYNLLYEGKVFAEITNPVMKEVYCMDTRFELNIKKVNIKGDDSSLYLYFDRQLVLKLRYKDIKAVVWYLLKKSQ